MISNKLKVLQYKHCYHVMTTNCARLILYITCASEDAYCWDLEHSRHTSMVLLWASQQIVTFYLMYCICQSVRPGWTVLTHQLTHTATIIIINYEWHFKVELNIEYDGVCGMVCTVRLLGYNQPKSQIVPNLYYRSVMISDLSCNG